MRGSRGINCCWREIPIFDGRQWLYAVFALNLLIIDSRHTDLCLVVCQLLFCKLLLVQKLLVQLIIWNQRSRDVSWVAKRNSARILSIFSGIQLSVERIHHSVFVRYSDLTNCVWHLWCSKRWLVFMFYRLHIYYLRTCLMLTQMTWGEFFLL